MIRNFATNHYRSPLSCVHVRGDDDSVNLSGEFRLFGDRWIDPPSSSLSTLELSKLKKILLYISEPEKHLRNHMSAIIEVCWGALVLERMLRLYNLIPLDL